MVFDKEVLADQVYKARHEMRLSQEDFAKEIGVNKNTVFNIENARSESPGAEVLMRICSVTGKSPNELLGWEPHAA